MTTAIVPTGLRVGLNQVYIQVQDATRADAEVEWFRDVMRSLYKKAVAIPLVPMTEEEREILKGMRQ